MENQSVEYIEMVYLVKTNDGKKYKFICDDLEFIKSFFSVNPAKKYTSIEVLREPTDADFDNLTTLG